MQKFAADEVLDLKGMKCPAIEFDASKQLNKMEVGNTLHLVADDPVARDEIPSWCRQLGHEMVKMDIDGMPLDFLIRKAV